MPALALTLSLLTAACSPKKTRPRADSNNRRDSVAQKHAGQTIDVGGRKHKVVAFTGYLEIDPYPTGKAVQGARILTKDGRGYLLAIRRYHRYLKYANRWVTGTGYQYRSSYDPRAQSIGLFRTLSLRLADGQKSHAKTPTRVPHPPRVRTRAELEKLPGRWAVIVEKPTFALEKPLSTDIPYHRVKFVTMTLPGGLTVKKHLWHGMGKRSARRLLSMKKATLVVRISRYGGKLKVQGSKYCPGVDLRCGMDRRPAFYYPTLVENYLDGSWRVEQGGKLLGHLTLYEGRYLFSPTKLSATTALKKRFAFLRQHKGSLALTFAAGLGLKTDFAKQKDHAILGRMRFNGAGETFLLRVDTQKKRLYLHATVSEFQTWAVRKSYARPPLRKSRKGRKHR